MRLTTTIGTALLGTALLAGCMTTKPDESQYSGWMKDYSNLSAFKTPSGATAMRWLSPELKPGQYRAIMIDPVGYYPAPKNNPQVSAKTLNEIPNYLENKVRQEVGKSLPITQKPGPGVLRMRTAITAVETPVESFKAYEVIPIALVFAGAGAAAGTRDHDTIVYLESVLTDSQSGKILGKVVRKGFGDSLENDKSQLTLTDTRPLLNTWATEAGIFVRNSVK